MFFGRCYWMVYVVCRYNLLHWKTNLLINAQVFDRLSLQWKGNYPTLAKHIRYWPVQINGNKFATNQILEKTSRSCEGADFSWLSSKNSRTLSGTLVLWLFFVKVCVLPRTKLSEVPWLPPSSSENGRNLWVCRHWNRCWNWSTHQYICTSLTYNNNNNNTTTTPTTTPG